jgi:AcrR family transcriptional regulator
MTPPISADTAIELSKGNYHHGDLRELLMGLALARIAIDGTEKFSLRALAREANVSATAPFRHFSNKHALFAALATEGFQQLGERVSAVAQSSESVDQRLLAAAMTYIEFAQDNPVAYQLMFGAILGDFSEFEGLGAAASGAYEVLDKLLVEVVEAKQLQFDELVLGGLIWSAIHGIASLRLNVAQQDASKKTPLELRPSQAIFAMTEDLEANLKIMIDGLLGQSSESANH